MVSILLLQIVFSHPLPAALEPHLRQQPLVDSVLAESIIGLYKTEVIHRRGPWRNLDEVEYATPERVEWFNHHRLLEPIGYVSPAEFEQAYYEQLEGQVMAA